MESLQMQGQTNRLIPKHPSRLQPSMENSTKATRSLAPSRMQNAPEDFDQLPSKEHDLSNPREWFTGLEAG